LHYFCHAIKYVVTVNLCGCVPYQYK